MAIGPGVLLPGVDENPTFPILSTLAHTTGWALPPKLWYNLNNVAYLGYQNVTDNGNAFFTLVATQQLW